ncbi:MAG TPA: DNA gyrase C-terminal beta-propeller domain-containing protein [Anaerolineae bacterium]
MNIERPDLSHVDPAVRAYVEALEAEIERLRQLEAPVEEIEVTQAQLETGEPPTTINVVTISVGGVAKRTPRHLYSRQRRGGMGVFDLGPPENDRPAFLAAADESQNLILITNLARAFRLPVRDLPESLVHGRGQSLSAKLSLQSDEHIVVVLPHHVSGFLAVLSWRGYVRCLPYNIFGESLSPGTALYKVKDFGSPSAACWTSGADDLFIATRLGNAIRFGERLVPVPGCSGIRLEESDAAVAVAAVKPAVESGVFLLGADGRGTIRLMSGFAANKAPGGGGKLAMKTDRLINAIGIEPADDVLILSRLGKLIRFRASEVPAKEGVVQGVNCIALRADDAVALVNASPP